MPSPVTGRILKAESARGLGSRVVFDFEDVQARANERVRAARREADVILAEARAEADAVRATAQDEGRTAGRAEGLADAEIVITRRVVTQSESGVAEQVATLLPAIREAARLLEAERDRWQRHWETRAVDLAVAIAERITRHEIATRPEAGRETLTEVLRLVSGAERIDVRMHPTDVERLGATAGEIVKSLAGCGEAHIVGDDSITLGGCVVETAFGTIDARIESQLDRIASELRPSATEVSP